MNYRVVDIHKPLQELRGENGFTALAANFYLEIIKNLLTEKNGSGAEIPSEVKFTAAGQPVELTLRQHTGSYGSRAADLLWELEGEDYDEIYYYFSMWVLYLLPSTIRTVDEMLRGKDDFLSYYPNFAHHAQLDDWMTDSYMLNSQNSRANKAGRAKQVTGMVLSPRIKPMLLIAENLRSLDRLGDEVFTTAIVHVPRTEEVVLFEHVMKNKRQEGKHGS